MAVIIVVLFLAFSVSRFIGTVLRVAPDTFCFQMMHAFPFLSVEKEKSMSSHHKGANKLNKKMSFTMLQGPSLATKKYVLNDFIPLFGIKII
jgi:hypothetical protein